MLELGELSYRIPWAFSLTDSRARVLLDLLSEESAMISSDAELECLKMIK